MAGRNISVTHEALGTIRVMKTCGLMGVVVGKAAAVAKKHGLSVDDIVGGKAKGRKSKAAPKYRNPDDTSQEWSGRGRQPAWFKAALAAGKKPESLEI